jgi:hypothetical protein
MKFKRITRGLTSAARHRFLLLPGALLLLAVAPAATQQPPRPAPPARTTSPKLEPVAETKLLMEGLTQSNFRGAERILLEKPKDADSWKFLRGQALLIGETGNLLLMRPPKNSGEAAWMERATDLRAAATRLARAAGDSDFERSRAAFVELSAACNRCHQAFRVPVKVTPFD